MANDNMGLGGPEEIQELDGFEEVLKSVTEALAKARVTPDPVDGSHPSIVMAMQNGMRVDVYAYINPPFLYAFSLNMLERAMIAATECCDVHQQMYFDAVRKLTAEYGAQSAPSNVSKH